MGVLLWPLEVVWRIATALVALTGRLLALVLGVVLLLLGALLTATVVGAVVGLPLMALGLLVVIRGLF